MKSQSDPAFVSKAPVLDAAWNRYHAVVEEMRRRVETCAHFDIAPDQRARAYHQLMEIQALTYNFAIAPRMIHPRVFHNTVWQTDVYCAGGNGPDFHYGVVFLDGAQTYRLHGNTNDSAFMLAQHNAALPGNDGARMVGNYDFFDFDVGADGSFEILLSAEKQKGNWIQLVPDAPYQWFLFRPTAVGWGQTPATLNIERLSPLDPDHYAAEDFDEAATANRIDIAANYYRYVVDDWMLGFYPRLLENAGAINKLETIGPKIAGEVGSPTAEYYMGCYEVEDDEALLIELPQAPNGAYWGFQIFDVWLRTIDFRTRQTTLNSELIATNPDGGVTLVLSRRDLGVANWLDTAGFSKGIMLLRNYRATRPSNPIIKRIKFAELAAHAPAGLARISPAERQQQLALRRAEYRRRHGE